MPATTRKPDAEPKHKLFNFQLPQWMRDGLEEVSRVHDRTIAAEIRIAIKSWLQKNGVEEPNESVRP